MRCETGVLVWRVIGVSVVAAKRGRKSTTVFGFVWVIWWCLMGLLWYRLTYGPSDHVKMWLKPHEATSFSAAARDCGMVFLRRMLVIKVVRSQNLVVYSEN